jgi:trk system potassium uptake protein TrkA
MRVAIAGAGKVGSSIAAELQADGHEVVLLDKDPGAAAKAPTNVAVHVGDACEVTFLEECGLATCNVLVAATGDDKVNLVISLLAKTEYGVPRVVARVNHPSNEWMFNESWGVDVSVSTPRILSALVEEAVTVGDVVRLFTLRQSQANLVEFTLPSDSPVLGQRVGTIGWPDDATLVVIARDDSVITPSADDTLEAHDELLFVATTMAEPRLKDLLNPR